MNFLLIKNSYKYRIYPNRTQKQLLENMFGCSRFIYNYFLNLRIEKWKSESKSLSYNACAKILTDLKKDEDYLWLNDVDSTALQSAVRNLDTAYKNFFEGRTKYPKFKSKKKCRDRYTSKNNNDSIRFFEKTLKLPKLGYVKQRSQDLVTVGSYLRRSVVYQPGNITFPFSVRKKLVRYQKNQIQ